MRRAAWLLAVAAAAVSALGIPRQDSISSRSEGKSCPVNHRVECAHGPTSRSCWGKYNALTNYYTTTPDTGRTVEYWLSVSEIDCAPDGFKRKCQAFNGTIPGPLIAADWGDTLKIHVTNDLPTNGTTVHWHGVRQLGFNADDGVPGTTQCPIAPGETATYEFRVTQYGSSWYHSHYSVQYGNGLFGPLLFNGPSTADYDIDLGHVLLNDWSHKDVFEVYTERIKVATGARPAGLESTLINGRNTFDCRNSTASGCRGTVGKKFELTFTPGKKHLLRLVNTGFTGVMKFSIDGHRFKVIANDFVPIHPYETDSVQLAVAQRYDIVVEADAAPGDYWMRGGWGTRCVPNDRPDDLTAIVRYDASSTAEPTTTSAVTGNNTCVDEPLASLVPYLALDVTSQQAPVMESVNTTVSAVGNFFQWTVNGQALDLDWSHPTLEMALGGARAASIPAAHNVIEVKGDATEWAVLAIKNEATLVQGDHPIHLHGHDFWVLAQGSTPFDAATATFNTRNPPRRDVATLPARGHLVIAFQVDNPGVWLAHCHIAWHSSSGLGLEILENMDKFTLPEADKTPLANTCAAWRKYEPTNRDKKEDSGI